MKKYKFVRLDKTVLNIICDVKMAEGITKYHGITKNMSREHIM